MKTIFVVNQIGSGAYGFPSKPHMANDGAWCGKNWFRMPESYAPPTGECREYRLFTVDEAEARDARIAELEKQLAERAPGVMPEGLRKILDPREKGSPTTYTGLVAAVEAYYSPPFVFKGDPGRYLAKWEDDNETPEECEICHPHNFPAGTFAALWDDGDWTKISSDGTFPGGRIVGRVEQ